ncbi:MAG: hypothetical protein K9G62_09010 [Alphaproteobacteria bacterium]|nr:hypothetical protein [Alphaproteobacteria bacterium]
MIDFLGSGLEVLKASSAFAKALEEIPPTSPCGLFLQRVKTDPKIREDFTEGAKQPGGVETFHYYGAQRMVLTVAPHWIFPPSLSENDPPDRAVYPTVYFADPIERKAYQFGERREFSFLKI